MDSISEPTIEQTTESESLGTEDTVHENHFEEESVDEKVDENKDTEVASMPKGEFDTLVLPGGSVKGFTTLGAIQYAQDNFLLENIVTYVGTSSGSIICYLLAIGYTSVEIMVYICTNQLLERMQHFNLVAMIQGRGATSFASIQEQLEKITIAKIGYLPTLSDLFTRYGKVLVCVTHNFTESRTEYLSYETYPHLPCITALRMSCNLPLVFDTFVYGNSQYIDGGISDNFGIRFAEARGQKVLGIALNSSVRQGNIEMDKEVGLMEFALSVIMIPVEKLVNTQIEQASPTTKIACVGYKGNINLLDFNIDSHIKFEMFAAGYEQMRDTFE